VRNTAPTPLAAKATFRSEDREPELWHPDSGEIERMLLYEVAGDRRVSLPLVLDAYGSVFVIFRDHQGVRATRVKRNGSEIFPVMSPVSADAQDGTTLVSDGLRPVLRTPSTGTYVISLSDGRGTSVTIPKQDTPTVMGPWKLVFPEGRGAPSSIAVDTLRSWTEFQDPGVRYFSGTATYETTFDASSTALPKGSTLWLNLGDVREVASVRVNGVEAGTVWKQPFRVRIDPLLKPGTNDLAIEVTNLWSNRLIGDAQPGAATRYTHTNIRKYTKDSPLLPSGLLGPVKIEIMYELPLR
jgi:hypothetical protein